MVPEDTHKAACQARARFPRGLEQPAGALRFGADALLLAAFATGYCDRTSRSFTVAELGSGCGAALLALALSCPEVRGIGLEREEALTAAARRNARTLGLEGCLHFLCTDVADVHSWQRWENRMDMVMTNPPYGLPGQGRTSSSPLREKALRDGPALAVFCRAAARLLRHHGRFCCIFEAAGLTRMVMALEAARLGLRRILPLRPHGRSPATRLLLEARKNAAAQPVLEAPLTLHIPGPAAPARWTRRALAFCPWLHTAREDAHELHS
ncbi:MAG: methyltransferase domain-containing protein [Desulfovibrio sp.]|nr:methyltransferase domain-containing protein [Desulfovibrio sp.]